VVALARWYNAASVRAGPGGQLQTFGERMMTIAPGDWVAYGCSDWGPRLFHPDDTHLKEQMLAAGPVCRIAGDGGEYCVLEFGTIRVRLRKESFDGIIVPRPSFMWGQSVRVKPPRTERVGTIRCIGWHTKQRHHLFWIERVGKKVKNRYFDEELEPAGVEAHEGERG
jgi:hypothetical protein